MGSSLSQPIFLNNNIIFTCVPLGELLVARKLFDEMPQCNVVNYNTMIGAEEAWNLFAEELHCWVCSGGKGAYEACKAFEDMPWKNLVTWNWAISLFGHQGFPEESIIFVP